MIPEHSRSIAEFGALRDASHRYLGTPGGSTFLDIDTGAGESLLRLKTSIRYSIQGVKGKIKRLGDPQESRGIGKPNIREKEVQGITAFDIPDQASGEVFLRPNI
jgi:hypothetical protein